MPERELPERALRQEPQRLPQASGHRRSQLLQWRASSWHRASTVRSCRSSTPVRWCRFASCRWSCHRQQPSLVRQRPLRGRQRQTTSPLCSVSSWFSSWGKSRSRAANLWTLSVTITKNVELIVPYVTSRRTAKRAPTSRTAAEFQGYVARLLHVIRPKMGLFPPSEYRHT